MWEGGFGYGGHYALRQGGIATICACYRIGTPAIVRHVGAQGTVAAAYLLVHHAVSACRSAGCTAVLVTAGERNDYLLLSARPSCDTHVEPLPQQTRREFLEIA